MNNRLAIVQDITCQTLAQKVAQKERVFLLDIRETNEVEICAIANAVHIPMNLIPLYLDRIPDEQDVVIYCHHGVRSLNVANYLVATGFEAKYIYNLVGGIDSWALEIDKTMLRY